MRETSPYPLTTQCACMDDEGRIWMVSNMVNGLFCLDPDTGKTEYVTSFEREPLFGDSLYTKALWYKGKMICIPCVAKNIAVYEVKTGVLRYIPIRDEEYLVYFNVIPVSNTDVLLFPIIYSTSAYIFHMDTEKYETIPLNMDGEYSKVEGKIVQGEALVDGKAYFVIRDTNEYFSLNMENGQMQFIRSGNGQCFFSAASDGKYLYLMHSNGDGYDVYQNSECISTNYLFSSEANSAMIVPYAELKYNMCFCLNDKVINLPMYNNNVKILENGFLQDIPIDWHRIRMTDQKIQAFSICIIRKETLILLPYHSATVVEIELSSKNIRYIDISIRKDVIRRLYEVMWKHQDILLFESSWKLIAFLEALEDWETLEKCDRTSFNSPKRKCVGTEIYNFLINDISDYAAGRGNING